MHYSLVPSSAATALSMLLRTRVVFSILDCWRMLYHFVAFCPEPACKKSVAGPFFFNQVVGMRADCWATYAKYDLETRQCCVVNIWLFDGNGFFLWLKNSGLFFPQKMKTLAETILEIEALLDLAVANLSG